MSGPQLRVVTYNVRGRRGDFAALAATVRDLAPDVLMVQEAPRRWRWRPRCAALARGFGMVVAAGGMPAVGNLILTDLRVAVERTWCVRFPLTPGRHLRGAALARCTVAGASFVAVGTHLATDPMERPQQARLLAPELAGVEAPVVLGADVNDEPGSATWETLAGGLVDPAVARGAGQQPTFPSHAPERRIDGVFVDARIEVSDYRVVDHAQTRRASDHLPVAADLQLPVAAPADERAVTGAG